MLLKILRILKNEDKGYFINLYNIMRFKLNISKEKYKSSDNIHDTNRTYLPDDNLGSLLTI